MLNEQLNTSENKNKIIKFMCWKISLLHLYFILTVKRSVRITAGAKFLWLSVMNDCDFSLEDIENLEDRTVAEGTRASI